MKIVRLALLFLLFPLLTLAQPDINSRLADEYFMKGENEKAAALYDELYDKNPTLQIYNNYLQALLNLNKFDDAEKLVKKQKRKNPGDKRFVIDQGFVLQKAGESKKSEKVFNEAIESLDPNQQQIIDLANAFMYRNLTDYSIETYKAGRIKLKDSQVFALEIASAYEMKGKYEEALDEYIRLIDNNYSFINYVQLRLQTIINQDKDGFKTERLRQGLLSRAQKNPTNQTYSELLLWFSVQLNDYETALIQAKAFDKRFKDGGKQIFILAGICMNNSNWKVAREAYEFLQAKGKEGDFYFQSRTGVLRSSFKELAASPKSKPGDFLKLEQAYTQTLTEFRKNRNTLPIMQDLAQMLAFNSKKIDDAISLLNDAVNIPQIDPQLQAQCKLQLADILLFKGDVWESTLLYSQVEKAFKQDTIGFYAKFKNAKLSYYIGEFEWALSQLDVLKAATAKTIANDAMELSMLINENRDEDSSFSALVYLSKADLLIFQNKPNEALLVLDSTRLLGLSHPIFDEVMMRKAKIFIQQERLIEADSILQKLVDFYPDKILADDALFMRAELNETRLKNIITAMSCYEKIFTDYASGFYAPEARKRFRKLRGDLVN